MSRPFSPMVWCMSSVLDLGSLERRLAGPPVEPSRRALREAGGPPRHRCASDPWDFAPARNGRQPLANHTAYPPRAPQSGLSLAVAPPRRLSGFRLQTNWSLPMLLPFDLRVDREGWTVLQLTKRPRSTVYP